MILNKPFRLAALGAVVALSGQSLGAQTFNGATSDPSGWKTVWYDHFSGTSLDGSRWNIETRDDGCGNNELQHYGTEGVAVRDGNLVITAARNSVNGKSFTSGRINSKGKVYMKHGKVEARIKMPKTAQGLWPAFWMLGEDIDNPGWPMCGEIDIVEMGNSSGYGTPETYMNSTYHWGTSVSAHAMYGPSFNTSHSVQDGKYHTFTLEWDENQFRTYVDGEQTPHPMNIGAGTDPYTYFHKNFHILFNLAVGGQFTNIYDPNGISATLPAEMLVDWVRVAQPENNGAYTLTGTSDNSPGDNGEQNGTTGGGQTGGEISPAPTPDKDAANVKSFYSDKYPMQAPSLFAARWDSGTVSEEVILAEGDKAHKHSNFTYVGYEFGEGVRVDVSDMEYLHVDIYPTTGDNINIYPICKDATGNTQASYKKTLTLTANQWNSFNIPVSEFKDQVNLQQLFQFKFDEGKNQTFYLDNLYFWKNAQINDVYTSAAVTIYENIDYNAAENDKNGYAVKVGEGEYNTDTMVSKGIRDNTITSLKVTPGYKVTLYKDDNFQGESRVITAHTSWVGDDWNDCVSSFKIEAAGVTGKGGEWKVINRNSQKYLDLRDNATADGTNTVQYAAEDDNSQIWIFTELGNGVYKIATKLDGRKTLDVKDKSTEWGAEVQIYGWSGSDNWNQQFILGAVGDDYYILVDRNSGLPIEIPNSKTDDGEYVKTWEYNGSPTQQWGLKAPQTSTPGTGDQELGTETLTINTTTGKSTTGTLSYKWNSTTNKLEVRLKIEDPSSVGAGGGMQYWDITNGGLVPTNLTGPDANGYYSADVDYTPEGQTIKCQIMVPVEGGQFKSTEKEITLPGGGTVTPSNEIPAAPKPTRDASLVKSFYSSAYTNADTSVTSGAAQWHEQGGHTVIEKVNLKVNPNDANSETDEAYKFSNFNFVGYELKLPSPDYRIDASDMLYIHVDIYSETDFKPYLFPICWSTNEEGTEVVNDGEKRVIEVKANQWNSFDIPLSEFKDLDYSRLYQFKFVMQDVETNGPDWYMDNLYLWKDPVSNPGTGDDDTPAEPTVTNSLNSGVIHPVDYNGSNEYIDGGETEGDNFYPNLDYYNEKYNEGKEEDDHMYWRWLKKGDVQDNTTGAAVEEIQHWNLRMFYWVEQLSNGRLRFTFTYLDPQRNYHGIDLLPAVHFYNTENNYEDLETRNVIRYTKNEPLRCPTLEEWNAACPDFAVNGTNNSPRRISYDNHQGVYDKMNGLGYRTVRVETVDAYDKPAANFAFNMQFASGGTTMTTMHRVTGIENPTGITTVETGNRGEDAWYTLQGVRVAAGSTLQPGIYIRVKDGRASKVLVK